jgi:isoquinoline 1-oxidoreductase beta subunit
MNRNRQSGLSRRSFLVGTAAAGVGLTVGVYLHRRNSSTRIAAVEDIGRVNLDWAPQSFIRIDADSRITVISKYTEMGQGIYTGLATIVAEELDAAWEQMHVEAAPANIKLYMNLEFGSQATGGSSSLASSFEQLRQVGAATRAMLLNAAAQQWVVPATELTINNGVIRHESSGRTSQFGELVELAAAGPVPETVALKPIDAYRLSNSNVRRLDIEDKVNGKAQFTQDFNCPGMKVAVVAHPPRFGGSVASYDGTKAKAVAGVETIVEIPTGVAVVANSFWVAQTASDLLSIDWDESDAFKMSSRDIVEQFKVIADTDGVLARDEGSIEDAFVASEKTLEAEFEFPFLAHATMEPLNCVVRWSGDKCKIWSGTQTQTSDQADAADILGVDLENVEVVTLLAGGGFGRRGCTDFTREALEIAKVLGPSDAPVKLMWTREDDMQAGMYRPLTFHRLRAGIDASGNINAWRHRLVGQSIAAQAQPEWIVNGVDAMSVNGAHNWLYDIPNVRVETHSPELPIPVLWYRGVGGTHAVYSVETFLDEIAALAGRDPLEYRLDMLKAEPRMAAVARMVAEKADWGSSLDANQGRGIALWKLRGTYLGQVAEVSVHDDNSFSVDRVVTAVDCGFAVNPDVIRAQMEGGTGFGLSSTLGDAITFRDGYVEQDNFDQYPLLRIGQMPEIDVHIMPSSEAPSGVGELTAMAGGAAVANALHGVTGKRYRSLPILRAG